MEQKMRGKTGEMERVRNERIGQKGKERKMEINVGEDEQEVAAAQTGLPQAFSNLRCLVWLNCLPPWFDLFGWSEHSNRTQMRTNNRTKAL